MPPDEAYHTRVARLPHDLPVIHAIRRTVFIEEQLIPEHLELDGLDDVCSHVLALSQSGEAVGAGRKPTTKPAPALVVRTESRVEPSVSGPPRRYYEITRLGRETHKKWKETWRRTSDFVDAVTKGTEHV